MLYKINKTHGSKNKEYEERIAFLNRELSEWKNNYSSLEIHLHEAKGFQNFKTYLNIL